LSPVAPLPSLEQSAQRHQLDLFVDGRDALLVHAVVTDLLAREFAGATAGLVALRRDHPAHPDLRALALLIESLRAPPPSPVNHATVTAAVDHVERTLVPAAQRLLGHDTVAFMGPLWRMLATTASSLGFDDAYPRAHASWLCQQLDDWSAVRAAVDAEPDWAKRPLLRYRLGLARHHLGDIEAAIKLWLPLCWIDPAMFARYAPTLPNATLREAWEAFERAGFFGESGDATHPTVWFPPWLLVRDRRLADLFESADVPEIGISSAVFRALLALVPLERRGLTAELIAHRRALQRLSPELLACYMESVGGRRPSLSPRHLR
jgi:hypothetical protein